MTQTLTSAIKPDEWSSLIPARTDRAVLVGQTGSGKTTLARYLLANQESSRKYRLVVDYKGMLNWPEYTLYRSLKTIAKAKEETLLYRPDYFESTDEHAKEQFWEWVYRRRHTTVYVDETAAFTKGDEYPRYFGACLMRGRELGIELWCATQRPTRIPQIVLSESEHAYIFKLRLPQDRERVEALTGIDRNAIAELQKQQFLYARQDSDAARPMKLKLS